MVGKGEGGVGREGEGYVPLKGRFKNKVRREGVRSGLEVGEKERGANLMKGTEESVGSKLRGSWIWGDKWWDDLEKFRAEKIRRKIVGGR